MNVSRNQPTITAPVIEQEAELAPVMTSTNGVESGARTAPAERANVRKTRGLTTHPSGLIRKERAMTHSSHSDRVQIIREALAHFEDWTLTNDRDPELAPRADRFLIEYVILNAHDESVRRMWRDYATDNTDR